jgi:hypothetical protein
MYFTHSLNRADITFACWAASSRPEAPLLHVALRTDDSGVKVNQSHPLGHRSGLRSARILAWLTAVPVVMLLLWIALDFLLVVDRGLDLTDEGLYLLAASATDPLAVYLTPGGGIRLLC